MTISDERLRWLSGPDYIHSEPGRIAAELLRTREALRKIGELSLSFKPFVAKVLESESENEVSK